MTVRKIFIKFCKNIESFVMKSKIDKRDVTFIREMRVHTGILKLGAQNFVIRATEIPCMMKDESNIQIDLKLTLFPSTIFECVIIDL